MGFTAWLGFIYLFLAAGTIYSFFRKRKGIGIFLSVIMILGLLILGYLWITSPM